jgi:hypothetical protein
MTKRALMREFVQITWHVPAVTWPQFLGLSIADRALMFVEVDGMIERHNREARGPRDDD